MTSRKGFFFTLIIFLLVSYILLSTSLWLAAVEESEKRYSEQFRSDNIEVIVSDIKEAELGRISDIVVMRSLYRLNEYSRSNPLKSGEADENQYLANAMEGLVRNGVASGDNFDINSRLVIPAGGMQDWADELDDAISKVGLEVNKFELTNFRIRQASVRTIEYSYDVALEIKDKISTTSIKRVYPIRRSLDFSGLTDAAVAREAKKDLPDIDVEKQYFFEPSYQSAADIAPTGAGSSASAQGWFYGPLVDAANVNSVPAQRRSQYILVGSFTQVTGMNYQDFGAVILTTSPVGVGSACPGMSDESQTFNPIIYPARTVNNKIVCLPPVMGSPSYAGPFAVIAGYAASQAPPCPDVDGNPAGNCVLFVARNDPGAVFASPTLKLQGATLYDMEKARDFAICGYYVRNPQAPSFFQRMLKNSFERHSDNYGIETFLVGSYVGGKSVGTLTAPAQAYSNALSRIDKDVVYSNTVANTNLVRAMPGCKYRSQCISDSPVGNFRLSTEGASRYGLSAVACNDGRATCS